MVKDIFYIILSSILLVSCNYSIVMNHTEGQASDLVDETTSPNVTPTLTPNISIIPK